VGGRVAALLIDRFQPLQTRKSIKLDAVNPTQREEFPVKT
jgi:hypothetical protein